MGQEWLRETAFCRHNIGPDINCRTQFVFRPATTLDGSYPSVETSTAAPPWHSLLSARESHRFRYGKPPTGRRARNQGAAPDRPRDMVRSSAFLGRRSLCSGSTRKRPNSSKCLRSLSIARIKNY
jgi:hypothetical protein